jgi:hypothetical protein
MLRAIMMNGDSLSVASTFVQLHLQLKCNTRAVGAAENMATQHL